MSELTPIPGPEQPQPDPQPSQNSLPALSTAVVRFYSRAVVPSVNSLK